MSRIQSTATAPMVILPTIVSAPAAKILEILRPGVAWLKTESPSATRVSVRGQGIPTSTLPEHELLGLGLIHDHETKIYGGCVAQCPSRLRSRRCRLRIVLQQVYWQHPKSFDWKPHPALRVAQIARRGPEGKGQQGSG